MTEKVGPRPETAGFPVFPDASFEWRKNFRNQKRLNLQSEEGYLFGTNLYSVPKITDRQKSGSKYNRKRKYL